MRMPVGEWWSFALGILMGVALCFAAALVLPARHAAGAPVTTGSPSFATAEARVARGLVNPKSVRFTDEMHGLKLSRSVCGAYRTTADSGMATRPVRFIVVEDAVYLDGDPQSFDRIAAMVGC